LADHYNVGQAELPPLRLTMLGDAIALGVGVERIGETVGGQLASLLAEDDQNRPVEVWSVAQAASRSADLPLQTAKALVGPHPDVAVILVGVADAARFARLSRAAAHLGSAVRQLRAAGSGVVVGTCLDLGALWALPSPLRQLLCRHGQNLARWQAAAAHAAGGIVVDLDALTGTFFRADPGALCSDGFHPSQDGYRVLAHALLPAVQSALSPAEPR
jgi:lysophospholipase L1-like esterase